MVSCSPRFWQTDATRMAFGPIMECYHDIISLDHSLSGSLLSNDTEIVFNGGWGYIEKDWGKSFPEAYVWIQSNHFQKKETSLSASIAKIPWLNGFFRGYCEPLISVGFYLV